MTSRNLFFKLAKEDLKRRVWLAALSILIFFFAFPVGMALRLSNVEEQYQRALRYGETLMKLKSQALLEAAESLVSSHGNGFTVFLMIMAAVVCGVSSFSYLHNKRKVDFYHSLPLKRETLFGVSYVMGILIPGLIYGLCLILSLTVAAAYGTPIGSLLKTAVLGWLFHLFYFTLVYSTVVLAMIMTGNLVVGILGSSVFFFYFPMLAAIIVAYYRTWFVTYVDIFQDSFLFRMVKISPITSYVIAFSGAGIWEELGYGGSIGSLIAESGIALIALILANILLYKKRPSEAAGKAMAFSASKPVIRIGLAMVMGMSGGMFFWLLHSTTGWAVFGTIVGILLCHCIVEIIYHFDFRKLLAHKFQLAGCMIAGLAILFCFKNDWLGYDAYLPEESQVAEVAVDLGKDGWVIYSKVKSRGEGLRPEVTKISSTEYIFNNMALTNTAPVLEIAKIGVEKALMERADRESLEKYDEEGYWTWVHIQYTLKNGRKVQRKYYLPLTLGFDAANAISMDPAYQDIKYPVFQRTAEDTMLVQYRVEGSGNLLESAEFSDQETIEQLLLSYQQDFREMDLYQRQTENPIGELRFLNAPEAELLEYRKNEYDNVIQWDGTMTFYPIYPCFDRTLALLEKEEIDPRKIWDHADITSVVTERGMKEGDRGYQEREGRFYEVTYTDPEEIQEILKAMTIDEYYGMNAYSTADDISVTVNVGSGNKMKFSVGGYFMQDKVPAMVEADLDQKLREIEAEFQDKTDETK